MKTLIKNKTAFIAFAAICSVFWLMPIFAAQNAAAFMSLSPREQVLLKSSKDIWPKLDLDTQQQLRRNVAHWQSLTPQQQAQLFAAQKMWDAQAANVRLHQRTRWSAWQRLGIDEQNKVKAAMASYRAMPLEEQQKRRAEFAAFSLGYQQQWWLGVALGRDAVLLEDWLRFVPDQQLQPWHQLLRELSPEQRFMLKQYGTRATPVQRDTLRTRLLSAPKAARGELLKSIAK
jgi:Protein of unknown function (DUF3106)